MGKSIKDIIRYYYRRWYQKFHNETFKTSILLGQQLAAKNSSKKNVQHLDEVAFQVFSQRGEDGVLQYIISQIEIPNKIFIEFGVENYTESNTRLLLFNNWRGMVIDSSPLNIRFIKKDFIYWKYDITAYKSFITAENINGLISSYINCTDIGVLSIDIDGNDYWVWEAITGINPRIVICEYNSALGSSLPVSIPYNQNFLKSKAHYSNLYYGASLAAICLMAEKKGYDFIGTTSAGVNAFFVRKDCAAPFIKYTALSGFHESANRDSKDRNGNLSFLPHYARLQEIKDMPLVNVITNEVKPVKELYNL
jgi:hypothetical protein